MEVIANFNAISLTMILQSEQLRAIYQANIDRNEDERKDLARNLHDDVLNRLAALLSFGDDLKISTAFDEKVQAVIKNIRQIIFNLRPPMLNYGLSAALEVLCKELRALSNNQVCIIMNIPRTNVRYDIKIEEYIFRIVQEACDNAIRHAHADMIYISGKLDPGSINVMVTDDGVGF